VSCGIAAKSAVTPRTERYRALYAAIGQMIRAARLDCGLTQAAPDRQPEPVAQEIPPERDEMRPLSDWHEDDGDVLWWFFPISEPPYVGSPFDSDWPGYHTHWTRFTLPKDPDQQPEPVTPDPREPDYSRSGIFATHDCWKCRDGSDLLRCPTPARPGNCGYPRARKE
jgi:hypothetical protein